MAIINYFSISQNIVFSFYDNSHELLMKNLLNSFRKRITIPLNTNFYIYRCFVIYIVYIHKIQDIIFY
jgi:hypothetical protein